MESDEAGGSTGPHSRYHGRSIEPGLRPPPSAVHYQHAFHAGNFADVLKHVVLIGVLDALSRKSSAWCFFDTHAGAGRYDLSQVAARRTGEWHDGIGRIWECEAGGWLGRYRACLREANPDGELRWSTGSPVVAAALARPQDRVVLCESRPQVAAMLRQAVPGRGIVVHVRDGYELPALLPPAQRRGAVLMDPPFERPDEFDTIARTVEAAMPRFPGAPVLVWYPVKNRHAADRFVRRLAKARTGVDVRLRTGARGAGQMRECGMLVLAPPYGWDLAAELAPLPGLLAQGADAGLEINEFDAGGRA